MKEYNILLCCGAGMSSGFLAQQMRASAKKRGVSAVIRAKSQNDIEEELGTIDLLLLGPHLAYAKEDLAAKCAPYHVPVLVIDREVYGRLDGAGLLTTALAAITTKEEG